MFYSTELLTRKGVFSIVWLAGTCQGSRYRYQKFLSLSSDSKVNLTELCRHIYEPIAPLSLRLRGTLLLGVCVLFRENVLSLERDVLRVWKNLQSSIANDHLLRTYNVIALEDGGESMHAAQINLPEQTAKLKSITLPLFIPNDDIDMTSNWTLEEDLIDSDEELPYEVITVSHDGIDRLSWIMEDDIEMEVGRGRSIDGIVKESDTFLDNDWYSNPSRFSMNPYDMLTQGLKEPDTTDFMPDIEPYAMTELDLLQNEQDSPIEMEPVGFEDAFMDMVHQEDLSPFKTLESSSGPVERIRKQTLIHIDERTELSSEKMQSWIDHPERNKDTGRIDMLHSSDALMSHHYEKRLILEGIMVLDKCSLSIRPAFISKSFESLFTEIEMTMRKRIKTSEVKDDPRSEVEIKSDLDHLLQDVPEFDILQTPIKESPIKDGISEDGWEPFTPIDPLMPPLNTTPSSSISIPLLSETEVKKEPEMYQETRQSQKLLKFIETKSRSTISPKRPKIQSESSIDSNVSAYLSRDDALDSPIKEKPGKWLAFDEMVQGSLKNTVARTFLQLLVLKSSGYVDMAQSDSYDPIYISVVNA